MSTQRLSRSVWILLATCCISTGQCEISAQTTVEPRYCLQAREFAEAGGRTTSSGFEVAPISAAALEELAPGMCADAQAAAAKRGGTGAGLLVQGGLVLHPERYVRCALHVPLVAGGLVAGERLAPGMCENGLVATACG